MRNYEKMGKTDLRAACKAAGISYGKMSVAEMRAALAARTPAATTPAPVAAPVVPHPAAAAGKTASVLKPTPGKRTNVVQREERNGVKKPGPGKCLEVWEAMQALYEKTGNVPTAKDATDWAAAKGANVSNATQELSRWRKFSGLAKPAKTGKGVMAKAA